MSLLSGSEARIAALEAQLNEVRAALKAVDTVAQNARQQITQLNFPNSGGGGAVSALMRAIPPGGGIAACTGSPGSYVLTSATCNLEYWDGSTWQAAGTGVVWNDTANSGGTAAGLSGKAMTVLQKWDGSYSIIVDPC